MHALEQFQSWLQHGVDCCGAALCGLADALEPMPACVHWHSAENHARLISRSCDALLIHD